MKKSNTPGWPVFLLALLALAATSACSKAKQPRRRAYPWLPNAQTIISQRISTMLSSRPASSGSFPIMMTTMAAFLGTLPIALGFGAGAESRRPLGLAVVGGLLFSQTLTLYVTPVVYLYMDQLQRKLNTLHIFQARKKAGSHE